MRTERRRLSATQGPALTRPGSWHPDPGLPVPGAVREKSVFKPPGLRRCVTAAPDRGRHGLTSEGQQLRWRKRQCALWSAGRQRDSGRGGHGDVSGVTTLQGGWAWAARKAGPDATARVLAFPLSARHVSTAGHEPGPQGSRYTESEDQGNKGGPRRRVTEVCPRRQWRGL